MLDNVLGNTDAITKSVLSTSQGVRARTSLPYHYRLSTSACTDIPGALQDAWIVGAGVCLCVVCTLVLSASFVAAVSYLSSVKISLPALMFASAHDHRRAICLIKAVLYPFLYMIRYPFTYRAHRR
jgi:hypothetical protein